ncbi:MAG TPA: sigma-70 family RNA polymerase sigma factor [Planctomycetota bacterium]|nr:sigma-70 family RNA polymerase sigma factor [Planctomycetota bacterium]
MQGDWDKLDDAALILAIQKGKLAAFTQLVDRHQRSLINFFFHLSWDRQVSEDCAQEVFLRLYSHLGTYEPQAKFTTFLFRVARNLWIDRMRSEQARGGKPVSLEAPAGFGEERSLRDRLSGPSPTPVEILARQETQDALKNAIDRLPEEQRTVLILSEIQGMKYQDIGAILDIPVGTVKSRMHTAMERLRELLTDSELQ